jgi:hypothetical protein
MQVAYFTAKLDSFAVDGCKGIEADWKKGNSACLSSGMSLTTKSGKLPYKLTSTLLPFLKAFPSIHDPAFTVERNVAGFTESGLHPLKFTAMAKKCSSWNKKATDRLDIVKHLDDLRERAKSLGWVSDAYIRGKVKSLDLADTTRTRNTDSISNNRAMWINHKLQLQEMALIKARKRWETQEHKVNEAAKKVFQAFQNKKVKKTKEPEKYCYCNTIDGPSPIADTAGQSNDYNMTECSGLNCLHRGWVHTLCHINMFGPMKLKANQEFLCYTCDIEASTTSHVAVTNWK